MKTQIALESISMDLKRVALGYYRGSTGMAERFTEEALKRKKEIDRKQVKPYIRQMLDKLDYILQQDNEQQIAEDTLMYSILLQNYCISQSKESSSRR